MIIKRARLKGRQRYNINDDDPQSPAYRLFNDWTGLEFLSRIAPDGLAPRLFAGHREKGFLVIEDVGQEDFGAVLLGRDAQHAWAAALQFSRALGKMQALSFGRIAEFSEIRNKMGPSTALRGKVWGTQEWFDKAAVKVRDNLAGLGIEPEAGFDGEMERMAVSVCRPGLFTVFTHGDPCPDNLRLSPNGATLIDFEFCRFRHALKDGAYARMLFPTCWQVNRLPGSLLREMEHVYREELAIGCPAAADDRLFGQAMLVGCAYWLLDPLMGLSQNSAPGRSSLLAVDRRMGLSTGRQVLLARLEAFCEAAEEFQEFPVLRGTFARLESHLRRMWEPLDKLPLFPAFRQEPS